MKVLIADDDAMTRKGLRNHLIGWGYQVAEAGTGNQAWDYLNADDAPRLAILDWMMPGMEGIEICRCLSQKACLPFIYTILLTIRREKEDVIEGLDSGAHDFLSKPVHAGELRSRIAVGARLVMAEDKIRIKNKELQSALDEIKTLKGILPICANCKRIRLKNADAKKQESWVIMEDYISKRTEAKFTHGICPECIKQLYSEYI